MLNGLFFFFTLYFSASLAKNRLWASLALNILTLISLSVFFGAMLGFYRPVTITATMILILASLYAFYKRTVRISGTEITALVVILTSGLLSSRLQLHDWDEFSHWGIVQKVIKSTAALSVDTTYDLGASYIQGYSLWMDFLSSSNITHEFSFYSASSAFMWIFLLLCNAAIAGDSPQNRNRWYSTLSGALFAWAFLWLALKANSTAYSIFTLYVDLPLAVFFTGGLLSMLVEKPKGSIAVLAASCVLLTMTKHTGLIFSIMAAALWLANILIIRGYNRRSLLAFAGIILMTLVTKYSWNLHLSSNDIPQYMNEGTLSFRNIYNLFVEYPSDSLSHTVLGKIIASLRANSLFGISLVGVILLSLRESLRSRKISFRFFCFYFASVFAYIGILGLSYRLLFSPYEAEKIASFDRYSNSLFLPWCLFTFAYFLSNFKRILEYLTRNWAVRIFILCLICITGFDLLKLHVMAASHPVPERAEVKKWHQRLALALSGRNSIYYIQQNSSGYECLISRYEFFPNKITCEIWSMGRKFNEADVWTHQISDEELLQLVQGHDYILIADDQGTLWKDHGTLFDTHQTGLFQVNLDRRPPFLLYAR